MTTPTITCEQFSDGLADLLERDADESTRARLEAHALSCSECGALLADLRKLRIDAAALPVLVPQRDLWAGIAARIETPVVELTPGGVSGGTVERWNGRTERTRRLAPLWFGLAAAGLVALTATVTHQWTKRSVVVATAPGASPKQIVAVNPPLVAPTASIDSVPTFAPSTVPPSPALISVKSAAEKTYDAEINRLRAVIAQRRSVLDSATVTVIERNLKVIDDAIAQCREALLKDPASQFLMESLNGALDTKIQLLRTAASLPGRA